MLVIRIALVSLFSLGLLSGCGGDGGSDNDANGSSQGNNPFAQAMNSEAEPRYRMANGCFAIQDVTSSEFVQTNDAGLLSLTTTDLGEATAFFMKPTTLGQYVFYDPQRRYMTLAASAEDVATGAEDLLAQLGFTVQGVGDFIDINPQVHPIADGVDQGGEGLTDAAIAVGDALRAGPRNLVMQASPVDGSEWTVDGEEDAFSIRNTLTDNALVVGESGDRFAFVPTTGCTEYPEAQLNASGTPFSGTNPDGTVFGYAETHMH
ncbi:MAG: hypothetical protein R3352_11400, partial [Salinisphaeraceae bacterium]|nr:hypothetical protein [Salinisphaeraceae bacterium]